jgi:3-hydroxyisobutyrate dehydrogenase-like beta-hydroxyacid dehydrogenase
MFADSASSAAKSARFIVLSLPDSQAVADVVREIEPVVANQIIVDTTTGDPDRTAILGQRLNETGVRYVDATIAGSSKQVREGNVIVMAGGDAAAVSECEPLFRCFATKWFHVGPCGSGARMKLVVNLVLGLNRAVLAEGLAFARACGLDPTMALEVLRAGAAYSRAMDSKGQKMIAGDFTAEARLSQHHKDVRLILQAAGQGDATVPLSTLHDQLLTELEANGLGESDNCAIIRAFDRAR